MKTRFLRRKSIVLPVVLLTLLISLVPRNRAWAIPTGSASAAVQQAWDQRKQDESAVRQFLADKVVRDKLTQMGLKPTEIETRLAQLSDQELRDVAAQIDQIQAGGWHATVIVLAVLAGIAVLIWYLVEHHHAH